MKARNFVVAILTMNLVMSSSISRAFSQDSHGSFVENLFAQPGVVVRVSSQTNLVSGQPGLLRPNSEPKRFKTLVAGKTPDHDYRAGASYLRQGNFGLATRSLLRSLVTEGNRARTHTALGAAYSMMNRADLAERHFVLAVEIDPTSQSSRHNLGLFYMRQGKVEAGNFHLSRKDSTQCTEVPVIDLSENAMIEQPVERYTTSCLW